MNSHTPDPSSSGAPIRPDAAGPAPAGSVHAGARYFVELGWSVAQARGWLEDSITLAQLPLGSVAKATPSLSTASGSGAFEVQVYRELEKLERQARATLLREVTARLARRAATPGAAGLTLLLPPSASSREALVERLQREGRRARSERLHSAMRSLGVERSPVPCDENAPGSIAAALAMTARWLWPGEAAYLAEAEVELAFGSVGAARATVEAVLDSLPEVAGDAEGEEDEVETDDEASLRETCHRLLTLVHFVQGDAEAALALTQTSPLVLDRSASMGAMRAAAEFRRRASGAGGLEQRPAVRDEFTVPIDGEERRRIARFLALAHAGSQEEGRGETSASASEPSGSSRGEASKAGSSRSVEGLPW
ncbi:hypothetical protein Poly30_42600 [Planctomycetes bacterium Poly30]|uniref:Uncharacterized protein n=1 Tax=Saltatorellus ferox TaxID=2528018 RepID=A0A518EXA7_9BACT|nr:hypothetical protein Poly30_42600 [Planctomycetes bacterium Poly30]